MDIFGAFDDNKYHIPGFFPEYTVHFNRVLDDCTCMNVVGNICTLIKMVDSTSKKELLKQLQKCIVSSIPETVEALCKLKYKNCGIIGMLCLGKNLSIHDFDENEPEYKFLVCDDSGAPLMIYDDYIDAKNSLGMNNYSILPIEYKEVI